MLAIALGQDEGHDRPVYSFDFDIPGNKAEDLREKYSVLFPDSQSNITPPTER